MRDLRAEGIALPAPAFFARCWSCLLSNKLLIVRADSSLLAPMVEIASMELIAALRLRYLHRVPDLNL